MKTFNDVEPHFPVFIISGTQDLWNRGIIAKTLNKLLKGLVRGVGGRRGLLRR